MHDDIQKILILRLSSFGDILLAFPLIHELRAAYPAADIDMVVKKEYSGPVEHHPGLDRVYVYDKSTGLAGLREVRNELRQKGYDLVLDIHKNPRSWYLRRGLGRARVRRYRKYLLKRLLLVHFKINTFREIIPISARYLRAAGLNGGMPPDRGFSLYFPAGMKERMRSKLQARMGESGDMTIFGFCPGAGFATKRWPVEEFGRLAAILGRNVPDCAILVAGSAGDAALGEYIREQCTVPVLNACGLFSFLESAALLSFCTAVIANDTGLMHAVAAEGVPLRAIFGPTTEELGYFPRDVNAAVIQSPLPCRPCTHNGSNSCPEGHFACMKSITAEIVWDSLKNTARRKSGADVIRPSAGIAPE